MGIEDKIYIFDDIVPVATQNMLFLYAMKFSRFKYTPRTADNRLFADNLEGENVYEDLQMVSMVMNREKGPWGELRYDFRHKSQLPLILSPLINTLAHHNYILDLEEIERVKFNLQFQINKKYKNMHNTPHIDHSPSLDTMWSGIYYANDSDGDTIFFELEDNISASDFFNENNSKIRDEYYKKYKDLKILKRIKPKKGRFVFFKNNIPHAGSNPINFKERLVINYNINFKEGLRDQFL